MKKSLIVFILGAAALGLAGCNGAQTNPLESNQDFQNLVPLHSQLQVNQEEPTSPFRIDIVGDNDVNFADFVEGQQGVIKFKVRVLLDAVQEYVLIPVTIPQGASFGRSESEPDTWVLSWSAPMGTVPPGRPFVKFPVELEAHVTKASDPRLLNFVDQAKPFEITVTKTQTVPTIVGVSQYKEQITEGDAFAFSVEVKDPTSNGVPPTLYRFPYNQGPSLENFKADGSTYVLPDPRQPLQKLANGDWKYNLIFDTKNRDLPLPLDRGARANVNADGISVCFNLQAVSPYGNSSPDTPLCSEIKYVSQAPVVVWDDVSDTIRLKAGSAASVKFTVKSPSGRGLVDVVNLSSGFGSWAGAPQLTCSDVSASPSQRTCVLSWNVPCTRTVRTNYTLVIKASDTIGQKTKTTTSRRVLEISKDACQTADTTASVAKSSGKSAAKASTARQLRPGEKRTVTTGPVKTNEAQKGNTTQRKIKKAVLSQNEAQSQGGTP